MRSSTDISPTPVLAQLHTPLAPSQEQVGADADAGLHGAPAEPLQVLDDEQEWSAFSRPLAGQEACWESSLVIEGMYCAACALTIEDALKRVGGVLSADVNASSQRAKVVWQAQQVLPSRWMQAINDTGYRALPANDALARQQRQLDGRKMLWRLMVAGLCMMQVMMYAYPAYVAAPGDLSFEMEQLLRWASWVLTLPVMLFSCRPFFASAWRDIVRRQVSMDLPVALGILITFAVSSAGTFEPQGVFGHEVYFDSLTMFVFFLLGGRWFELRLRSRTAGALEALMNCLPDSVQRQQSDGSFARAAIRRLRLGDVIQVRPGETFPADGVLLQGQTLVDESLLTGESRPLSRSMGQAVICGSHNLSAVVRVQVERLGRETRFAQIVELMQSAATSKPQLARMADSVAKPFLLAVLLAAALAGAYWWPSDPERALMVAVSVLVVTCPCALSLATPAAMLAAAGKLAQRGVLVRQLNAFEVLAKVDMVMFDKTGTLTRDAMVLAHIEPANGLTPEQALALAAALAQQSLHPVSASLLAAAKQRNCLGRWQAVEVLELSGQGLSGSLLAVAGGERIHDVRLGSAAHCGVKAAEAATTSQVFLSQQGRLLAVFDLQEDIRADAQASVASLKAHGLKVCLLSGDTSSAVQRVAQALGIDEFYGHCSPQDKLDFLRQAQHNGHKVAMVGDGLNDGPVLAGAHASFAFGQAVPLAQARADFLVYSSRLLDVAQTLVLARRTLRVVKQNLGWALTYNAVCVPLAMAGMLPAWLAGLGMAGSSLLVVGNALRLSGRPAASQEL